MVGFSKKSFKYHKGISGLKYYLIVMYLRKHLQTFGEISFTLNGILEECGYSTKSHNASTYSDFRNILQYEILDKGYAKTKMDIKSINPSSIITLQLSEEKSLFFTNDNFVQLSIEEFETITNFNEEKINKSVLIGTYLYIKQFIISDSIKNEHVSKISYPSKLQIKNGIGVSSTSTIEAAIKALSNMKLLYVASDMFIEDSSYDNIFIPARNVYALKQEDLNWNFILKELENVYHTKVYRKSEISGEIQYLPKWKNE